MIFSKNARFSILFIYSLSLLSVYASYSANNPGDHTKDLLRKVDLYKPLSSQATTDELSQSLAINECLFEGISHEVLEILKLNKNIPQHFHKIIVFTNQHDLETSLGAQAVAIALKTPSYTIDFKQQAFQENKKSLLGKSHTEKNAHHGELFNACVTTNSSNPTIILKNLQEITPHDREGLHRILSAEENVCDEYFGISLPTNNFTFIATTNSALALPEELIKTYETRFLFIENNSFSRQNRQEIAARFFLPEILAEHGLKGNQLVNIDAVIAQVVDLTQELTARDGLRAIKYGLGKVILHTLLNASTKETAIEIKPEIITQLLKMPDSIELPEHVAKVIKQKLADSPLNIHAYKNAITSFPWHKPEIMPLNVLACFNTFSKRLACVDAQKRSALFFLNAYHQTPRIHRKALCIVGPSGGGKTAFAELIAAASGRQSSLINLAHHPALSGDPMISREASPGAFFKALCSAKTQAPVIILDNIDKAHALNMTTLPKALSPKYNEHFFDMFADFTIDLSNTLFITTATDISALPEEVLEHLECIYLPGYTPEERELIITKELLPAALEQREMPDQALQEILTCIPTINSIVAPNNKGLHELARAISSLVSQQIGTFISLGTTLSLTPENTRQFLDPQVCAQHISEAKNVHAQCNEILKTLNLTPEQFKKIDSHITALKPWKGGDALTLLYIDWIQKYPFNKPLPQEKVSLEHARAQLDATHYGLQNIKENILDFLAGLQRRQISKNNSFTKTLCFSGGPGIGKTTFSKSIADSLGLPFGRIALESIQTLKGGMGEHEMFGDGPGALGKAICEAGSQGAVILLDEIDKACPKVQCQLLEILDPAQNKAFRDSFLGLDLDLSHIIFIASANDISKLPHPLHDRLHIIEMNAYSYQERAAIAEHMIIPDIVREMNFDTQITNYLNALIQPLTRKSLQTEYGVRNLKRMLYLAADKYARMLLENKALTQLSAQTILAEIHPELLQNDPAEEPALTAQIGITNGMYAAGKNGGGIFKIAAAAIPNGDGKLLTNILHGKMSRESHTRTLTFVKMNAEKFGIRPEVFKTHDFSFTDQTYGKTDGPSAGIAQTIALISALTKRAVRPGWAMTGAIDAYGTLLPVGGYRAKILGTAATGIKNFIIPECARPTIEALAKDLQGLNIVFAQTIDDALNLLLEPAEPARSEELFTKYR